MPHFNNIEHAGMAEPRRQQEWDRGSAAEEKKYVTIKGISI